MKTFNNTGNPDSYDIVHMKGDKDKYSITESAGTITFESTSLDRKYIVNDIESTDFKYNDIENKNVFKYIDLINIYGLRRSCLEILNNNAQAASGLYIIKPDGINDQEVMCDMSEGWTLTFAYDTADHNIVDETAFPNISDSRDKLLSKTWGGVMHGTGHTIGNITNKFKDYITDGSTQLMTEIVRVDNDTRIKAERFQIQDKNFIDRVHTNNQADCWSSMDGSARLIIANYISPAYTYNKVLKAGCSGAANTQTISDTNYISTGSWGIDGALIFSEEGSGAYGDADKDLTIHVNWYGDRAAESLYTNTTNYNQTKWGTSATWLADTYGRNGATPGPMFCAGECGYTNSAQNTFKMRLWIK